MSITEALLKNASLSPISICIFVHSDGRKTNLECQKVVSEVIFSRFGVGCESVCGIEFQYRDFTSFGSFSKLSNQLQLSVLLFLSRELLLFFL